MSSIIRSRNGVIEVSLHWSIEPADLRQPMQRILSVVPPRDTAVLLGEAVQSNACFLWRSTVPTSTDLNSGSKTARKPRSRRWDEGPKSHHQTSMP
jgi:hypothetical protein